MLVKHKRGATFAASGIYRDSAGNAVNLTGYTVTSQVRGRGGKLIETLAVTVGNQGSLPGSFSVRAEAAATADWPIGPLLWDVRFESGGGVVITDTVEIQVERAATEAA